MYEYIKINNKDKFVNHLNEMKNEKCVSIYGDEKFGFIILNNKYFKPLLLKKEFIAENYKLIEKELNEINILIFFDAKKDLKMLLKNNIKIYTKLFDCNLAKKIIGFNANRLTETTIINNIEESINKNMELVKQLEKTRLTFVNKIKELKVEKIAEIEFSCVKGIAEMENTGFRIDIIKWYKLIKEYEKELNKKAIEISDFFSNNGIQISLFGENNEIKKYIHSNKKVIEKLKEYGIDTDTSSKKFLAQYKENEFVKTLLEYRELDKIYNSSLISITNKIEAEMIYPEYSQIGAGSGRMSCSNPNIQQIPREKNIRECFLPSDKENVFVIADYSQIELRVVAEISKDIKMIEAYKKQMDLHSTTASLLLEKDISKIDKNERQAAKAINFGLIYAMGADGLKRYCENVFNIKLSIEMSNKVRNRFLEVYEGVREWQNTIKRSNPITARSLAGRPFKYSTKDGLASKCNIPVQGTAADIIKEAICKVYENLKDKDAKLVAVIHDEIIIETNKNDAEEIKIILKQTMENVSKDYMRNVPLVAEAVISNCWIK